MITDTSFPTWLKVEREVKKRVALSSQTVLNLMADFTETCSERGFFLSEEDVKGLVNIVRFNIHNMITQVQETLKTFAPRVEEERTSVDTKELKGELVRQIKLNQMMKEEVLELNQLISEHLRISDSKLQKKDQIIERLKLQCLQLSGKLGVVIEEEQGRRMDKPNEICIIDEDEGDEANDGKAEAGQPGDRRGLDIIIQEEEMFSTSRYQPSNIKVEVECEEEEGQRDQSRVVKYKTEPNEVLDGRVEFFTFDQSFQSSRKSEGKSRTKFFLDDFRKIIETQSQVTGCSNHNNLSKGSSKFASGESSQSRLSVARNESQNINTPYKTSTPKRLFTKKKKPEIFSSSKKHKIKFTLNGLFDEKVNPRERPSSINAPKERPSSATYSRISSKEKLKEKDMNLLNVPMSRPSSKEKLSLTIKTDHKRLSGSQQMSNRVPLKRVIEQQIHMIDLEVGDRPCQIYYQSAPGSNGGGVSFYNSRLRYEGSFKESLRHGNGILYSGTTEVYRGEWERNKICGKGVIQNIHLINCTSIPEGSILRQMVYAGEFEENRLHGSGQLVLGSNEIIRCNFHDNRPQGPFQYTNKYNEVIHGFWFSDR